jgi:two-component system phosphate regulon sensor histidine kinase PhoR
MLTSQLFRRLLVVFAVLAATTALVFGATQLWVWVASLAISTIGGAATYLVANRIIGPLEPLTQAARQMAAGQLPSEVHVRSRNELGTLAVAFNTMSRQLSVRIQELEEQRRHVEHSHARLETLLGAMQEGVLAVDAQECILFANNAAIHLLDLNPATMLGRPIWEAVRHPQLQELVQEALSGEQPPRLEFDVARTQSTVAATVSPLPGQPVPGAVMVLHDVTELRRLESLRREFVQNVSHELKTPLSSIAAYADTLLEGALDDPEINRQFVEQIAEQSDRLHTLILDLLALGRMDSEQNAFEVEPTDVTRIITASVDAHRTVAAAKRLTLTTDGPPAPLFGLADDEGLRTIIDNLLDNAINYTSGGGTVALRWRRAGESIIVEVEDTGVGIAREHQARIFERFYRIDKARSRELGGTGLGLSIVKHLCQVFGGSVKVTSQLGRGSTFTVRLKAAEQLAAA